LLGYPDAALGDIDRALKDAREVGQATTLMFALYWAAVVHTLRGNYAAANTHVEELIAVEEKIGAPYLKALGVIHQGIILALTGRASDAVELLNSGMTAYRATRATLSLPTHFANLARAYANLGQFQEAWRCIGEAMNAMETNKAKGSEGEIFATAGEIALMSPEPDVEKAEAYFERALSINRERKTKSPELRTAMRMARLWRDQGKRKQAHDLLAPVYGWFTEGFDTLLLKEAKALLDELA
jgi:tetratricopeptide (TPR) repeat protein